MASNTCTALLRSQVLAALFLWHGLLASAAASQHSILQAVTSTMDCGKYNRAPCNDSCATSGSCLNISNTSSSGCNNCATLPAHKHSSTAQVSASLKGCCSMSQLCLRVLDRRWNARLMALQVIPVGRVGGGCDLRCIYCLGPQQHAYLL